MPTPRDTPLDTPQATPPVVTQSTTAAAIARSAPSATIAAASSAPADPVTVATAPSATIQAPNPAVTSAIAAAEARAIDDVGWHQLAAATSPPARRNHTLTFIPTMDALLMFGGRSGDGHADTWRFDIAEGAWREIIGAGPAARFRGGDG